MKKGDKEYNDSKRIKRYKNMKVSDLLRQIKEFKDLSNIFSFAELLYKSNSLNYALKELFRRGYRKIKI